MARLSLSALQPLGRALMLPIAVLPVAGLLLRLGQPDMLDIAFIASAGDAIFHNLGLLFAIGVAVGFAKDGNGAAALAGAVCFLIATNGAEALMSVPADALAGFTGKATDLASAAFKDGAINKLSVPLGILSGLIAGGAYNRFGEIRLPEYLAFFGGRRFVPIVSGLAGLVLALVVGISWTRLSHGIDDASRIIVAAGPLGLFIFGVLNRLLIVTGLHHILNNIAWFVLGDFHGATGDLHRFFAGDPSAGAFMSGFFPVMMFGLPAACLAMYHTARPERRKAVGGMLLSLALTAMLTGVTEPIEFTFMFLAPVLYGLHAVMTGLAMVIMDALKVRLGFSFSAGLFDYVINFGKATKPLLLIPVGFAYFALYYGVFRFAITRFNLKTPGREPAEELAAADAVSANPAAAGGRPQAFITALGGPGNLISVDACTTRLRLVMADQSAVNEPALKALGARGLIRPSPKDLQVVMGPIADQLAREIRTALGSASAVAATPAAASSATAPTQADQSLAAAILAALGGPSNLLAVEGAANRLLVSLVNTANIDETAMNALGLRGLTRTSGDRAQLLLAGPAAGTARALGAMLPVAG
ncbi:MAG: N-acetyl-D-glucosamine transporter [Caulobacter sp.]|nr:N-acetyl-D-glucosamine transporter [Caulobacter sp.]